MDLQPEQESLLATLVEAARRVPTNERHEFTFSRLDQVELIHGPGAVAPLQELQGSDLYVLRDAGLIGVLEPSKLGFTFYVTPDGFAHYGESKQQAGGPAKDRSMVMLSNPSVFVAWAQREPGWNDDEARSWRHEVASFIRALRRFGIDADVDLHHLSERGVDWTRFGSTAIMDCDWVLVLLSPAWRARWEGGNDPTTGAGAVSEANALRSVFARHQQDFLDKLVLLTLPSMAGKDLVPNGLHGVQHRTISNFDQAGLSDLLRLLTGQDEYPVEPLGTVPQLPPALPVLPIDEDVAPTPAASSATERTTTDDSGRRAAAAEPAAARPHRTGVLLMPTMSTREILDAASPTPGGPDHWMVYDGMLLVRFIAVAKPTVQLRGTAAAEALDSAAGAAEGYLAANLRPAASGTLVRTLRESWTSARPRRWSVGHSETDADLLAVRETAAAVFVTDSAVLTVDRTLPTRVLDAGSVIYHAAFEPVIGADVIACCVMVAALFGEAKAVDIAVQIASAPSTEGLVSAESYAPMGSPFMEPHEQITPPAVRAPSHHLESTRASLDELERAPEEVTRRLLDDWLVTFRDRELFTELRPEAP